MKEVRGSVDDGRPTVHVVSFSIICVNEPLGGHRPTEKREGSRGSLHGQGGRGGGCAARASFREGLTLQLDYMYAQLYHA